MDSSSDALPPGTDLCQVPTAIAPPGQSSDLNSTDLKSLTISLSVILTTIAVIFGLGRLYVNFRKLAVGDCKSLIIYLRFKKEYTHTDNSLPVFVFIAMVSNITSLVLIIICMLYFILRFYPMDCSFSHLQVPNTSGIYGICLYAG